MRTDVPAAVLRPRTSRCRSCSTFGKNEDRDNNLDNALKKAFTDPKVLQLRRFYGSPLRSAHRDVLQELRLPATMTQEIAFATPNGKVIDRISPSGVADPKTLADKMRMVFDSYRRDLFTREIQPELDKPDADPQRLLAGLGAIRDLNIVSADAALIRLTEREKLDNKVRFETYEVLAALSTKPAVEKAGFELAIAESCVRPRRLENNAGRGRDTGGQDGRGRRHGPNRGLRRDLQGANPGTQNIKWWSAENRLKNQEIEKTKQACERGGRALAGDL